MKRDHFILIGDGAKPLRESSEETRSTLPFY